MRLQTLFRGMAAGLTFSSLLALAAPTEARADTDRGTFYVQGAPGMLTIFAADATGVAWHPDVHVGVHFGSGHEGGVIAFQQSFYVGDLSGGASQLRGGYDIGILLKNGMEITLSPHAKLGLAYAFEGGDPLFAFGFGFEGRFFPIKNNGFYAFLRPLDIDFWVNGDAFVVPITFALGAGYAF